MNGRNTPRYRPMASSKSLKTLPLALRRSLPGAGLGEVVERALRAAQEVSTACRDPRAVGELEGDVETLRPLAEADAQRHDLRELCPGPVMGEERQPRCLVHAGRVDDDPGERGRQHREEGGGRDECGDPRPEHE